MLQNRYKGIKLYLPFYYKAGTLFNGETLSYNRFVKKLSYI